MNVELFVIVAVLAVIAAVAVWLLRRWAAKPDEWESRIPPQKPQQPLMPPVAPKEPEKKTPQVLPPERPQPKRK